MPYKNYAEKLKYMRKRYRRTREQRVAYNKRYYLENRERICAERRAYRKQHPDKVRATRARLAAKLTPEKRAAKLDYYRRYHKEHQVRLLARARKRKGKPEPTRPCPTTCECCGRDASASKRRLALDHCHATGVFRGWLCGNCNLAIGLLGDGAEGVSRALEYLKRAGNG